MNFKKIAIIVVSVVLIASVIGAIVTKNKIDNNIATGKLVDIQFDSIRKSDEDSINSITLQVYKGNMIVDGTNWTFITTSSITYGKMKNKTNQTVNFTYLNDAVIEVK